MPRSNAELNRNRSIKSVNHRGYCDAPENTISAFRLSKEKGFDTVECDVRFTRDDVPVLLHDVNINRTSNGKGKISGMTLDEVRKYDFGSWKDACYFGEKIPTFYEFIDLCMELSLHPYIEIKNGATADQVTMLVQAVEVADIDVTWIARNIDYLSQIHKLRSRDRLGLLVDVVTEKAVRNMLNVSKNLSFINANHTFLTAGKINLCKKYSIPLEVWTVDDYNTITHIDIYISGITSNKYHAELLFKEI